MIILEVVEYTYRREPLREFEVSRELRTRVPDDVPCALESGEPARDASRIVLHGALKLAWGQLVVVCFRRWEFERRICTSTDSSASEMHQKGRMLRTHNGAACGRQAIRRLYAGRRGHQYYVNIRVREGSQHVLNWSLSIRWRAVLKMSTTLFSISFSFCGDS